MDNTPISGISELQAHLQQLAIDPALPPDAKLLDDVELQLTEDNIPPLLPTLLPPLANILKSTTQDPTPLLSLTIKLLSPLSFTQALGVAEPSSLLAALASPLAGANLLALAITSKAAASPSDASILSTLPEVVEALVRCWLASPDVGVGERAARVLGDVLETDCEVPDNRLLDGSRPGRRVPAAEVAKRSLPGHGRLWRLVLGKGPILRLIHARCSAASLPGNPEPVLSDRQVTISQGRLLRLLPRLSVLNIRALSQAVVSDVFALPVGAAVEGDVGQGLLQWAALGMVNRSDVLMHLTLIDFFETFVSIMKVSARSAEADVLIGKLVKSATRLDRELEAALRSLPDRTTEEEAEPLRAYIADLLD
ncbi:uncharacterized protein UV8b_00195 [Ustilaginoidea virens]|uniref:DNA mismatch repair protein HSM3 N-terminal domain-containing protein n=1 Tax=Ustilaginoidea virens TaxID=1159556 RepID=A0A063BWX5_USTVR|nr:uncharacterized protein UV8b_00195 [Ustilaginoidea virens]QUC15954.1 hypothetical protein UV8b_00195 [Ustilaginoidea virens]GAO17370.1 hypothetical protein UVI_02038900 [Ustilaginoidea virens]